MKKMLITAAVLFAVLAPFAALAEEGGALLDIQSCRTLTDLAKKYGAEKRLPESVVVEGKPCPKSELAQCLLSVMEKVCEKCDKEGCAALSYEDRENIARLHDALKDELSINEAYAGRREAIERMLARPEAEQPPFLVGAGVDGFLRGEGAGNFRLPVLSYDPGHAEGRIVYCVKPYVYWRPTDYLDIHLEGQGYGYSGSTQETGRFNLYQGFVEAKLPDSDLLALKAGRQEFSYGSGFILSPNVFFSGLAFDAARLRVKPASILTVDFLGGLYAAGFNNGLKGDMEGVYAAFAPGEADAVEAYFFRDTGSPVHHAGEHRDIWGLRGTAKVGPVSLEFEPVYESGEVFNPGALANDNVGAYGGHVDLTYETGLTGFHHKFIASYAMGSGSRAAAAGTNLGREFKNPNNYTYLVGDMTVVADLSGINVGDQHASGIQVYNLVWGVDLRKDLSFSAAGHYFLANDTTENLSRRLGVETDFTLTYTINKDLSLTVGYDRFFTGGFFRGASGAAGDIDYGYAMLNFDFNVTKLKGSRT
jgi:Alginate export